MDTFRATPIETSLHMPQLVSACARYLACSTNPHLSGYAISNLDIQREVLQNIVRYPLTSLNREATILDEIENATDNLVARRRDVPKEYRGGSCAELDLQTAELRLLDRELAVDTHRSLHYLGSPRPDGVHLGLFVRRPSHHLLGLATLSAFDLTHMSPAISHTASPDRTLVLSRMFITSGSPKNTASFMLARVFSWIRLHLPEMQCLLTYCNPNLGFTGTIYRATNWVLFGYEQKRRNLYLDGHYLTDRQAIWSFGTADFDILKQRLGLRISRSEIPFEPLYIYLYVLDRALQRRTADAPRTIYPLGALVGA